MVAVTIEYLKGFCTANRDLQSGPLTLQYDACWPVLYFKGKQLFFISLQLYALVHRCLNFSSNGRCFFLGRLQQQSFKTLHVILRLRVFSGPMCPYEGLQKAATSTRGCGNIKLLLYYRSTNSYWETSRKCWSDRTLSQIVFSTHSRVTKQDTIVTRYKKTVSLLKYNTISQHPTGAKALWPHLTTCSIHYLYIGTL